MGFLAAFPNIEIYFLLYDGIYPMLENDVFRKLNFEDIINNFVA